METVPLAVRQLEFAQSLTKDASEHNYEILVTGGPAVAGIIGFVHRNFSNVDFAASESASDEIEDFLRKKAGLKRIKHINSKVVYQKDDLTVNHVIMNDIDDERYTFNTEHYFNDVKLSKRFFAPYNGATTLNVSGKKMEFMYTTLSAAMIYCSKLLNNAPARKWDLVDVDMIKEFVDENERKEIMKELVYL